VTSTVEVERVVAAPAGVLYDLVADVTRMGEWSPETSACAWMGDASGPEVGARFRGRNRRGARRWSTVCTVTDAEPGRRFAFDVAAGPLAVARWEYRFEAEGASTRVVETWTDRRGRVITVLGRLVSGVDDRAVHNRATMTATLERLAAAAGSAGGAG
jgi:hypothetical protein